MVFKKLKTYRDLVMFDHTLFSMPQALATVFIAAGGFPGWYKIFWVIMAMVGARNGANALNRVVDAEIDAKNKRTAGRHIPRGIVKKKEALALTFICFLLFVLSAFMLNPICVLLLPIPVAVFIVYSYTKRFTWLCHLVLAAATGMGPIGAWLAINGKLNFSLLPAFIIGAAVGLWVGGFDIIYATQDVDFDMENGLHSVPVKFGIPGALKISILFHAVSILLLLVLPFFAELGILYYIGLFIISLLLFYEHSIVSPEHLQSVKIASYGVNQIIGVVFFIFTAADIFLRWYI